MIQTIKMVLFDETGDRDVGSITWEVGTGIWSYNTEDPRVERALKQLQERGSAHLVTGKSMKTIHATIRLEIPPTDPEFIVAVQDEFVRSQVLVILECKRT